MALIPTTQVNVSPDDYKRKMAYALMMQGSSAEPVQHWTQGLARLAQGGIGGYEMYKDEQKQKQDEADANAAYLKVMQALSGGQSAPTPSTPPAAPQAATSPVAGALAKPVQMASLDPKAITGPRPGGDVMPSAKVWGDKEAEAAGLYEKPAETKVAQALTAPPAAPPVVPTPTAPQMSDARLKLIEGMLQPGAGKASAIAGRALGDMYVAQAMKPQDFEFKDRGDGTTIAINKHNPADVRIVQSNGQNNINYEAQKAGAIENAKRQGEADFQAEKTAKVTRAELQAKKDFAKPEQDKQAKESGDIVTTDIDRAIKLIDNKSGMLPTTGATGNLVSNVGGTAAHDLGQLITGIKANVGFAELQKMRQASPTGGALGQVTEQEHKLLSSVKGSVEQSQSSEQLKYNLKRLKNLTLDIVHGPGSGPARETLAPPKVSSPAEARKYPKGTQIELPDGSIGVVP